MEIDGQTTASPSGTDREHLAVSVCFVALNALPAIDSRVAGPIGGVETRSWTFARGLARDPEWQVRFVVRHPNPLPRQVYDSVRVALLRDRLYPIWQSVGVALGRKPRFPWIGLRRWNWRLLWQLPMVVADRAWRGRPDPWRPDQRLAELHSDVFCTFGVQTHSATVIASAQSIDRPVVLFLGSDGDLDPVFERGGEERDPYGTRGSVGQEILRRATAIVAQTAEQQTTLRERFGRESILIRNPIDVAAWDAGRNEPLSNPNAARLDRFVLWIGRAEETHKRPSLCLEVASRCPDVPFLMVLNPRDPAVSADIAARAPSNVRIAERLPFDEMPAVFSRAAALVSTSALEGFPNVFLQAALSGTPIASLEVGRGFLECSRAGVWCAGDLDGLTTTLRAFWTSPPTDVWSATAAREYVAANHGLEPQVERLRQFLAELVRNPSPR